MAQAALVELADAQLIVLALHQTQFFPYGLMEWLESWAVHRQVQDAALAAYNNENGVVPSVRAVPELSQFAERHGLTFVLRTDSLRTLLLFRASELL